MENTLDNLERCPRCHLCPSVTFNANDMVEICCLQHGHMAMGDTCEMAIRNWNIYIKFVIVEVA